MKNCHFNCSVCVEYISSFILFTFKFFVATKDSLAQVHPADHYEDHYLVSGWCIRGSSKCGLPMRKALIASTIQAKAASGQTHVPSAKRAHLASAFRFATVSFQFSVIPFLRCSDHVILLCGCGLL